MPTGRDLPQVVPPPGPASKKEWRKRHSIYKCPTQWNTLLIRWCWRWPSPLAPRRAGQYSGRKILQQWAHRENSLREGARLKREGICGEQESPSVCRAPFCLRVLVCRGFPSRFIANGCGPSVNRWGQVAGPDKRTSANDPNSGYFRHLKSTPCTLPVRWST